MKIFTIVFIFLWSMNFASAQSLKSCCSKEGSSTQKFAVLGEDESFSGAHAQPLPVQIKDDKGEWIRFDVTGGENGRAYLIKSEEPSNKYIFVFHEWWGLNNHIINKSLELYNDLENVNVMAIDLYDGKTTADQKGASKLMQQMKEERGISIIKGAVEYVGDRASIETIGWCFGGGWSLQAAIIAGPQAAACVMYYGMPESDLNNLRKLEAPVLGIFAEQDNWITDEIVADFKNAMSQVDKKLVVKWYDAVHAFANPSNPEYDKQAAAAAYELALEFLRKH